MRGASREFRRSTSAACTPARRRAGPRVRLEPRLSSVYPTSGPTGRPSPSRSTARTWARQSRAARSRSSSRCRERRSRSPQVMPHARSESKARAWIACPPSRLAAVPSSATMPRGGGARLPCYAAAAARGATNRARTTTRLRRVRSAVFVSERKISCVLPPSNLPGSRPSSCAPPPALHRPAARGRTRAAAGTTARTASRIKPSSGRSRWHRGAPPRRGLRPDG